MANSTLTSAIQNMIDDVERATAMAGLLLKDTVHKDFDDAAHTSVDKYYSYKNGYYTKYGRKHRLYGVYDVNTEVYRDGNSIVISTGIYMDSDKLDGLYHNRLGEQGIVVGKWTDVDADYVFKNFISGKHPWTNGWPLSGASELEYGTNTSKPSPDRYLKNYVDRYIDVYFNKHVQRTLDNLIKVYG